MELNELKHKSLQFELSGVDEEQGIFEGYASVFGVLDSDGDIVDRGAFTKTIAEGMAKDGATILALHNDRLLPVGKTLELREDDIGLYIKGYISPTSMGKDVRILVRDRVLHRLYGKAVYGSGGCTAPGRNRIVGDKRCYVGCKQLGKNKRL